MVSINQIIQDDAKILSSALSADLSIQGLEFKSEDELTHFGDMPHALRFIDQRFREKSIQLDQNELSIYTGQRQDPLSEYYRLGSHMLGAPLPFLFYTKDGVDVGCLVKIVQTQPRLDPRFIQESVSKLVEKNRGTATEMTMKQANKAFMRDIKSDPNYHNAPILTPRTVHNIYFNFEKKQLLIKNSGRRNTIMHMGLRLIKQCIDLINSTEDLKSEKSRRWCEAFSKFDPSPGSIVNLLIREHKTKSIYSLDKLVGFYAQSNAVAPVSATESAELKRSTDHSQKIVLKESLSLMTGRDKKEDQFMALLRLSKEKECDIGKIEVEGTLDKFQIIKELEDLNGADNEQNPHMTFIYKTHSVMGNISFAVKRGHKPVIDAAVQLISEETGPNNFDLLFVMGVAQKRFGQVLEILHNSSDFFLQCYIASCDFGLESFSDDDNAKVEEGEVKEAS